MTNNPPMRVPDEVVLDPANDPQANALAQRLLSAANDGGGEVGESPQPPIPNHSAIHVDFLVGLANPMTQEVLSTAEVRELNGEDEEHIARGKTFADRKARVIERGVVSLGGEPVEKDVLLALASADREAILLGIARATYGDTREMSLTCRSCGTEQATLVDLSAIKMVGSDDLQQTLTLKDGTEVLFHWMTGDTEKAIGKYDAKNPKATVPEMNTQLLAHLVDELNGVPFVSVNDARRLSMRQRSEILDHIAENAPGPQSQDIPHECESCGKSASLEVTFADLFR